MRTLTWIKRSGLSLVGAALVAGGLGGGSPAVAAEPVTLGDVAPPDTMVIVGTDDWKAMDAAWTRSSISGFTTDPEFKELWKSMWEALGEEGAQGAEKTAEEFFPFKKILDQAGVKVEDLPLPSGSAGLCVFWSDALKDPKKNEQPEDEEDAWRRTPESIPPGLLLMGDFGERAGEVEAAVEKAIAELVKRGEATSDQSTHAGVTIHSLNLTQLEERWKAEREERAKKADDDYRKSDPEVKEEEIKRYGPGAWMRRQPVPMMIRAARQVHVARVESRVMMANDLGALQGAIERAGGERGGGKSETATRASYQAARRFLNGAHVYAIALVDAAAEITRRESDEAGDKDERRHGPLAGVPGDEILTALGVKGTQAIVAGAYLDTERGPLELRAAVLHPRLGGLFTLLGAAPKGFEPPAFVSSDAMSVGTLYVNFDKVLPFVRQALKDLPEDSRPFGEQELAQVEGIAGPVLASLGGRVHILTTISRPMKADSEQTVWALELKDADPIKNILTAFGASMGLKPRDFEGNQIFSNPEAGEFGLNLAVGVGFGHAFIGGVTGVENAMRQASRPANSIASKPEFVDAAGVLRPGALAYSYQDMRESLEMMIWQLQNPGAALEAMGIELDEGDEPEGLSFAKNIPSADRWLKYIGDAVTEVIATDNGVEFVVIYRAPKK